MNGKFILLEGSADGVFEANIKPHQVSCGKNFNCQPDLAT